MRYVVQVASGKEQATLERIQKFVDGSTLKEVFIPRRKVIRKRCGEELCVSEVLFPGYVFVVTENPAELFSELKYVRRLLACWVVEVTASFLLIKARLTYWRHFAGQSVSWRYLVELSTEMACV